MRRIPLSSSVRTAWLIFVALIALAASAFIPNVNAGGRLQEPKEFDRLDGHGATTKKVDVIEWEGNLELHVYPRGSLKSLGLKIDDSKTSKNKVMVIEYGFNGVPYTLIRRAVLSISLPEKFRTFRDETADDYDKIIISGNGIAGASPYVLAAPPAQLYPDYHPALAENGEAAAEPAKKYGGAKGVEGPSPASVQFQKADEVAPDAEGTVRRRGKAKPDSGADADGSIRNFAF